MKGFISTHSLKVELTSAGKSRQEADAAGLHPVKGSEEDECMHVCQCSTHFSHSHDTEDLNPMALPKWTGFFHIALLNQDRQSYYNSSLRLSSR